MSNIPPVIEAIDRDNGHYLNAAHLHPHLFQIFGQMPVAMCLLEGPDCKIAMANDAMLRIWGKEHSDITQTSFFDLLPHPIPHDFAESLALVYQNGTISRVEEMPVDRFTGGQKERLYIKLVCEAFRKADGTIGGILVVIEDVTEHVRSRQNALANEIRHELAMEAGSMASFEWIFDRSEFIYSQRLTQIFGLPHYLDFDQSMFISMIHPDDRALRDRAVQRAMSTGTLFYEARIVWTDGSQHWIRLNGKVERAGKTPVRMIGMVMDITLEKQQSGLLEDLVRKRTRSLEKKNRELEASEMRYQRMTEEVQDYAILLLGLDGTIMNWNRGAEKIKGYTEQEIVGKKINVFYLPEDQETKLPESLIRDASIYGRAVHEGYRIRKDGTKFWGSITITAIHDTSGTVIGFSKVTRDLTERKIAEDKLRKYTAELEFQNRELEQFAYIASHDLQEPLRKIRMFTGMLGANLGQPEQAAKYFEKIDSSASRMSDLIQSVLNYSRLIKADTEFEQVDLTQIVSQVLFDFELMIEEKGGLVKTGKLPAVRANALQMHQLFYNLIGNALKFCNRPPRISIGSKKSVLPAEIIAKGNLSADALYYCISVSDNGIGFEQQYADQIFTIFQRLNHKLDYQGTGIGLALCKKIADNHQGVITARSVPGSGSKFCIFLPVDG